MFRIASLLLLLTTLACNAQADCFSRYSHKACGPNEGYTCKQKQLDVQACQEKEKAEAKQKAQQLERDKAQKEAAERRAIESINKANKAVHSTPQNRKEDQKNSTPAGLQGTTF